jgi:hypothetical protein
MKHLWAASVCVRAGLFAACLSPAWAEPPEPPPPSAAAPLPFDAVLEQADRRFVDGDLDGALQLLAPVCAGSERAECAFSLGAIHHGLGHCPEARAFYLRYLELAAGGERVGEVRDALQEVEARCGDAPAPAMPRVLPTAAPSASGLAVSPSAGVPEPAGVSSAPIAALPPAGTITAGTGAVRERSLSADLAVGSFVLAGAAALSSIAFGLLAAHDASRCADARTYDSEFIARCENSGPRYQGLWQGFALASGSFLGIGAVLWAFDPGSPSVAAGLAPQVGYRGRF